MPTTEVRPAGVDEDLAGLDALELAGGRQGPAPLRRLWSATWPKLGATALALLVWQLVVWSGWKEEFVLPGPDRVLPRLWDGITDGSLPDGAWLTLQRAAKGFVLALVIGVVVGALVARVRLLRAAFGSLITGLQTMPSIAWFPLALLLFKRSEGAILFVIVLGAAPAIANGLIAGTDTIPPLLLRAGRVLGARGFGLYRHVVLPASLPAFVGGVKQGWAFAWRSLLAGELLVIIPGQASIGVQLDTARQFADAEALLATMLVILVIGIVVDALVFGTIERAIRRRWGLLDTAG